MLDANNNNDDDETFNLLKFPHGNNKGEKTTLEAVMPQTNTPPPATSSSSANLFSKLPVVAAPVMPPKVHFWSTAFVITLIFLLHGWLAELIVISVVNNGYSLGWFFALLTVIGQWVPTLGNRGWKRTDGMRKEHVIVGFAHCFSLGLSNSGGMLVEYNTYSLFKSSKVVFVMVASWLLLGVSASAQELFWGLGLMMGLLMLTGADEKYSPESNRHTSPLLGTLILSSGITCSALVSVGQQAALQRRVWQRNHKGYLSWQLPNPPASQFSKEDERESLLFWSNLISICGLGTVCLVNGELLSGVRFFKETATLQLWGVQFLAMFLVSVGQRLVLSLNGTYGATASAAVLTFRKVASFITSVMVFPKPFHPIHMIGLCVVVGSAVMIQRAEMVASSLRKKASTTTVSHQPQHVLTKVEESV